MADYPKRQDYLDVSNKIVNKILADLTDRRGFRQEWDMTDKEIQNEIEQEWNSIVYQEIIENI